MMRIRNSRGQAVVELALAIPILMLLLLGIINFGWLFAGYLELQHVARDGARYAAIHTTASDATVKSYITGRMVILKSSEFNAEPSNFQLNRVAAVTSGSNQAPAYVKVSLKYPFSTFTGSTVNLRAEMSMRRE